MQWNDTNRFISAVTKNFKYKEKLACFDLDSTLIKTKSGKKFSTSSDDWVFYSDTVVDKLKELVSKGYCIIIITNQAGLKSKKNKPNMKLNSWKSKLDKIVSKLDIEIALYASITHDLYRKPLPGFMQIIEEKLSEIDVNKSFYCGDACGRPDDFSDSDYKFALNTKLRFITPNELFDNEKVKVPKIEYLAFDLIKNSLNEKYNFVRKDKEVILMVGMPGSGKSTFVNNVLVPIGYSRINRDALGTVSKCLKCMEIELKCEKNVVIDNTNSDKETRAKYIKIAKKYKYNIRCIILDVPIEIAMHNAIFRFFRGDAPYIPELVYRIYKKNYSRPTVDENIDEIVDIKPKFESDDSSYMSLFMY